MFSRKMKKKGGGKGTMMSFFLHNGISIMLLIVMIAGSFDYYIKIP